MRKRVSPWRATLLFALGGLAAAWGAGTGMQPVMPLFEERAEATGLVFRHFAGAAGAYYLPEIMGPGAALFDYDGDGDLDVYLIQGSRLTPDQLLDQFPNAPQREQELVNRLFRNDLIGPSGGGTLHFTDVTAQAGVGHAGYGMGVAVGDYDGDQDLDFYLTNFGENVLYRNNGDGTFSDVTRASGTGDERWSTSAAFLDYDRDGDLDLFFLNYIDFSLAGNKTCYDAVGALDYCNPNLFRPLPDRLLRNDGRGMFVDVTENSRLGSAVGPGLGVICADFDLDGWIDVYVANDGAPNYLWMNQRDGSFEENGLMSGSAYNAEGAPEGSMGVGAGDFDNDGDEDLFMTHLTDETNTLYVNDGQGNFLDETAPGGLGDASLPFTGFGTAWLDYDNDGLLDLFVANGAVRNLASLRGEAYPYHQPNQLFHNQGGRFLETSGRAGPSFRQSEVSRGTAIGDVDNDGDLDILIANNNGPARLLLNQTDSRRHWLSVRLEGSRSNRFGVGARVAATLEDGRVLWRRVHSDGSYLSAGDLRVHFGLGSSRRLTMLTVLWPEGRREQWKGPATDTVLRLRIGSGEEAASEAPAREAQRPF